VPWALSKLSSHAGTRQSRPLSSAAVDDSQVRAFIVARRFLDRAEVLGEDATETDRMAAVVLADLAVEVAAKAALRHEALSDKERLEKEPPLPLALAALTKLWRKRENTQDDVPEVREARRLHDVRNSVQHAGLIPSSNQVAEARVGTLRFLTWMATGWFKTPFESISRSRLIENEAVRTPIELAEKAGADEDYATAAGHLAVAFEMARLDFRAEMREGRLDRHTVSVDDARSAAKAARKAAGVDEFAGGRGFSKLEEVLAGLAFRVRRLDDQVEALTLGARVSDYTWFRHHFPGVARVMRAGRAHPDLAPMPPMRPVTSRTVYLRGLDFVTTTALHWQEFPQAPPADESPSGSADA
jgi:hypothetical protein